MSSHVSVNFKLFVSPNPWPKMFVCSLFWHRLPETPLPPPLSGQNSVYAHLCKLQPCMHVVYLICFVIYIICTCFIEIYLLNWTSNISPIKINFLTYGGTSLLMKVWRQARKQDLNRGRGGHLNLSIFCYSLVSLYKVILFKFEH